MRGAKSAAALALVAVVALAAWLAIRPARRAESGDTGNTRAATSPTADRYAEHPDTVLAARLDAIARSGTGHYSIVAKRLSDGRVARVNADTRLPLMSVVKLPIAVVVLDGVDQGRWTWSTPITLLPQDMHPRGELGDRYPRGGGPVTLHRLIDLALTRSDNTAADALLRLAGGPLAVTEWLERHGIRDLRIDRSERGLGNDWYGVPPGADTMSSAEEIRVLRAAMPRAVHDSAAAAMLLDVRDTGTADACVHLLERLWRRELLSATSTDTLEAILARCRTAPNRLPALLPKGTPVARKTGTGGTSRGVTVAINDVGVVRLPNGADVAIAVLVGEPRGTVRQTEERIARIAREVFEAWGGGGR